VNYAVRRGKWDENEKEKTNRKLENKKTINLEGVM